MSDEALLTMVITGTIDEIKKSTIGAFVEHLRKWSGDAELTFLE